MKALRHILVIAVTLLSTVAIAQDKKLSEEQKKKAKENFEVYFKKLNLSDAQKTSYENIALKYGEQLKFVKESGYSKKEKLTEIQRIQKEKDAEFKKLLSKEQYTIYLEYKAAQRKNLSGQFSEYSERLNLTEEQRPKFIEITQKYTGQLKALKDSSKSRFSKYRDYKKIVKNRNKEMKALLSSQQYEVYLEVQKEIQKKMKENRKKNQ